MPPSADQIHDHNRDLRKNGDLDPLPFDAHTVALLARVRTTSFDEAVSLIQSFADTTASVAVVKAIHEVHAKTMKVMNGFCTKEPTDA